MSPVTLVKPTPSSGGFTDSFRLTKNRHTIRVYPFKHEDKDHLAAVNHIHFVDNAPLACVGKNCAYCAQAMEEKKTSKDKRSRLRRVTRYPMAVVDVESDPNAVLRFDAPATIYKAIYKQLEGEDAMEYLGNNGMDFIIDTNKNASNPSDTYAVKPRIKGSEALNISDSDIPDLVAEVARDFEQSVRRMSGEDVSFTPPEEETTEGEVVFKDAKGKEQTGTWTGKKKDGKYVIEHGGHLIRVDAKNIVSGIEEAE